MTCQSKMNDEFSTQTIKEEISETIKNCVFATFKNPKRSANPWKKKPNLNTACQLLSTVNNNHLNTGNKNNNIFNRFSKIQIIITSIPKTVPSLKLWGK